MMEEDELDPRIQVELEKLNSATDVINRLEIELDEANTTFRMLLNECTRRLKVHSSKHGGAIENARPYYEALEIARKAQQDCQQAAVNFQRANEVHEAAKETVALAESRFMSQQPEWRFDSAWQEMLNHATIKVRDAEKQRAESSAYHSQATARYKEAQEKVQLLEQRLRRNVAKSRPYFEEKQRCNEQLAAQKDAVEMLAAKVARVKSEYAESLRRLEGISEEIHRKRGNVQTGGCGVREPGVGAELVYKGEQEHCDSSREATFVKMNYNYDAKLNANDLPKISDKQLDSTKENFALHTKDCIGEDVRKDFIQVFGDFHLCTDTSDQTPDIRNNFHIKSNIPQTVNASAHKKISFESLHGLHFNPSRDVHHNEMHEDADSDNIVSANTCEQIHLDCVCPSVGASSCVPQSRFKADECQAIKVEQDVSHDKNATDNKSDISKELENHSGECSDCCKVESSMGVRRSCGQLTALTCLDENKGAKNENDNVVKAPSEKLIIGIDDKTVGAQGDTEVTPRGLKSNIMTVCENQTTFETSWKQKSVTASECSNTSFTRQPDLELSFHAHDAQRKDDEDSALKQWVNTQDVIQVKEVPGELGVACGKK